MVAGCIVDASGYRLFVFAKLEGGLTFIKPAAWTLQALTLKHGAEWSAPA